MRPVLLLAALAACTAPRAKGRPTDDTAADPADPADSADTGADAEPDCPLVTFIYDGLIKTVSGRPLGLDIPLDTPIAGSLGYKPCLPDRDDFTGYGEYRHGGSSTFEARFLGRTLTGSGFATVEVVQAGSTWRYVDGHENIPDDTFGPRALRLDGAEVPRVELWISTGPEADTVTSEAIPAPDWLDPGAPHTFSIADDDGVALVQWTVFALQPQTGER
jgi:hypothetical protein